MRYSPNLNIVIKAVEKASNKVSRDFTELENLQNNPTSAIKFANFCYNKAKEIIVKDLQQFRPQFDLYFLDGEIISNNNNCSEYSCLIIPIDGFDNLNRANQNFTIAVALRHHNKDSIQTIGLVINDVTNNNLYYCEKGLGAFVNNRRIRVSKRNNINDLSIAISNYNDLERINNKINKNNFHILQSVTLQMSYLASAKYDLMIISGEVNLFIADSFSLLVKEAGGSSVNDNDRIIFTNNLINNISTLK
jgi:myo-inositol-1(or 4)-monophosphatase